MADLGGLVLNIAAPTSEPAPTRKNAKQRKAGKKVLRNRRWDRDRVQKRTYAKSQGRQRASTFEITGGSKPERGGKRGRDGDSYGNPQPGDGYKPRANKRTKPASSGSFNNDNANDGGDAPFRQDDPLDDIIAEAMGLARKTERSVAAAHEAAGIAVNTDSGGVAPIKLGDYPEPACPVPGEGESKPRVKKSKKKERDSDRHRSGEKMVEEVALSIAPASSGDTDFKRAVRAARGEDPDRMDAEDKAKAPPAKKRIRGAREVATEMPKLTSQDLKDKIAKAAKEPLGPVVRAHALFGDEEYASVGLDPRLVKALDSQGITRVTKIQALTIPPLIEGKDAMIKSITGSGKTLSFVVPMLQKLISVRSTRKDGTLAMIIGPTRELCQQIASVIQSLCNAFPWLVIGTLIGGDQRKHEKARLRKGVSVVVGTPGRLIDHLQNTQSFILTNLRWLILDEADRLLDLGFEKQLMEIVDMITQRQSIGIKRQNVLVSATLTESVERLQSFALASDAVTLGFDAVGIKQGKDGAGESVTLSGNDQQEQFVLPAQLSQQFLVSTIKDKLVTLCAFLRWKSASHKMIVFFASCDSVDFHASLLQKVTFRMGKKSDEEKEKKKDDDKDDYTGDPPLLPVDLYKLHGNVPQAERTKAIAGFRKAEHAILLCSDVAARGLDINDVDWIVQYELPGEPSEYVHRIGRTARLGRKGHALLFLTPAETDYIGELRTRGADIKPLAAEMVLKTLAPKLKDPVLGAARLQVRLETAVEKNQELQQTAGLAYQSTMRAYTAQPKFLKSTFTLKNVHLGHLAKAFALKQTPSKIAAQQLKIRRKADAEARHKKQQKQIRKHYKHHNPSAADEYAA